MDIRQLTGALLLALTLSPAVAQQAKPQTVFTEDIDRFWVAYDSVRSTTDPARQLAFMQNLYIKPGTEGLAAFMQARNYSAELWVELIGKYPRYWNSIRPNTLAVKTKTSQMEQSIRRLKRLYPALRPATMYFSIGGMRSGGTVEGNKVLVGTELATGNAHTDVSELPGNFYKDIFQHQSIDNLTAVNVHEYVHTQQHQPDETVLTRSLREGACDFVAELVTRKPLQANYLTYGAAHEAEIREQFRQEMFTTEYSHWLYNGLSPNVTVPDLGYFMGYVINKAYYSKAKNKRQALRDIMELEYGNLAAVESFLRQSGYYPEGWDRAALLTAFTNRRPAVSGLLPFANGSTTVDPAVQEIVVEFDREMNPEGTSFAMGPAGKDHFPLRQPLGFTPDGRRFRLQVALQPQHDYEFLITPRGFKSKDGQPLRQEYLIRFRTR